MSRKSRFTIALKRLKEYAETLPKGKRRASLLRLCDSGRSLLVGYIQDTQPHEDMESLKIQIEHCLQSAAYCRLHSNRLETVISLMQTGHLEEVIAQAKAYRNG